MRNNNFCVMVGNVGKDAEIKFLDNGTVMGKASLAISRKKDETTWLNLVVFGTLANLFSEKVKKGCYMRVVGEYWPKLYTKKDGTQEIDHTFIVNGFEIEAKKVSEESAPTDTPNSSNAATENPAIPF